MTYRCTVEFNIVDEHGVSDECVIRYDNGPVPRKGELVYYKGFRYQVGRVEHQPNTQRIHVDKAGYSKYGHVIVEMEIIR